MISRRMLAAGAAGLTSCFLVAAGANPKDLTAESKKETVAALSKALEERYVFPDKAKAAAALLRENLAKGAYDGYASGETFAGRLHSDVNSALKDAHFRVRYSAEPLPKQPTNVQPSPEMIEARRKFGQRANGGYEKVERLIGNVGYLQVNSFGFPDLSLEAATAAMKFLARTDALIIDMRQNGGGSPEAVRDLCSYLFGEKPVHLNSIYNRMENATEEFWTHKELPGPRYVNKPVYVLCSKRTGSAAEEFCYNLQNQKRATLVGEVTWGGANPGGVVRLNDHFAAFISTGRAINPITKTNWEGVGVQPDVLCSPDQALNRAHILAVEGMLSKTTEPEWKRNLEMVLAELKGKL